MKTLTIFSAFLFAALLSVSAHSLEYGVATHLNSGDRVLAMKQMGAKWIRIDFNWVLMEPQQGHWDFSQTDHVVNYAKMNGLKVFATLAYAPPWASSNQQTNGVPDKAAWENFVRVTVGRYKNTVDTFGIWNEPNLGGFWAGTAQQYCDVVAKPAQAVIRSISPTIPIAGPELAHLYGGTIPVLDFLKTVKNTGTDKNFDVITHHIYAGNDLKNKINGFKFLGITYKPGLKQWLDKSGIGTSKPVWISEFGADSLRMSLEAQASELVRQIKVFQGISWIKQIYIFELDDNHDQPYNFGVLTKDGVPKPAYFALKDLLTR